MAFLPINMDYLTEEMMARAEDELGETSEMKREALTKFRKLINKDDPKLQCQLDDSYLLQFLRARKFDVKRAFSLIHNYYSAKKSHTDVYSKPDLAGFKKCVHDRIINILPYRDEDGAVFILAQLSNWNVNEIKFSTVLHAATFSIVFCVDLFPATQICGVKLIIDTKGLGLRHVKYISPKQLHLVARGLTNCLPIRLRAVHLVNESFILSYAWNIVKLLLTEKIRNRVHFHASSVESLHKQINPNLLPTEYGGTLVFDNTFWKNTVDEFEDRYYELMSFGYKSRKNSQENS